MIMVKEEVQILQKDLSKVLQKVLLQLLLVLLEVLVLQEVVLLTELRKY